VDIVGRKVAALVSEAYSRLYHRFGREFPDVYADDRALAAWVRLLLVADASWPMRPPLPRSVRVKPLNCLVEAGLVILEGDAYTVRGLDAERTRRSDAGRVGAAKRWQSERNANAMPRRDETRLAEDESITPPPPTSGGRRKNGTNPRATGESPRQNGSDPRTTGKSVRAVRVSQKRGPTELSAILRRAAALGHEA